MEEIKIGDQIWSKNLNVDTFRNGDPIPHAETEEQWVKAGENGTPAWCYYDNDPANGETYGKLYNWYAVTDPRGLAPEGWHVPGNDEWTTLTDYLGGEEVAGTKMKSTSGWEENHEAHEVLSALHELLASYIEMEHAAKTTIENIENSDIT